MNGYQGCISEYFNIWNKFGVEPKVGQKKQCPDKPLFFQNLGKKHRNRGLERIWKRFGTSKYLVIWTFEQIDELQQAATVTYVG